MSRVPITNLFNAYDLQVNPLDEDKIRSQDVVNYCEARFRVALQEMMKRSERDKKWMSQFLFKEMELCFSYIGVAAAIGQPLNIPVIVRSLGQDLYRLGLTPDSIFRPGLELITYLDGNLSSNGLDDPALEIAVYYLAWWTPQRSRPLQAHCLSSATIKAALEHYRKQVGRGMQRIIPPYSVRNLDQELNKPAYTWHSSAYDNMPNTPDDCTRCRLYRAVAAGVMDQIRDTYNMVHACEVANEAEKDLAIRRASGFNVLFEAVVKKSDIGSASASGGPPVTESGDGEGKGRGKEKQQFGPEVQKLKDMTHKLIKEGRGMTSSQWISGVGLTKKDLLDLTRGADRDSEPTHSGYDSSLQIGTLLSDPESEARGPFSLEDPTDTELRFDELSADITTIPELSPNQYPTYFALSESEETEVGAAPDLARMAHAKTVQLKAQMQTEVDQPDSYFVGGPEFDPRIALVPRRPWLVPYIPIILPPTLAKVRVPNTIPGLIRIPKSVTHLAPIDMPESDEMLGDIDIPDSDEMLGDIDIPDSDISRNDSNSDGIQDSKSTSSDIYVEDSDNVMDVDQSDEQHAATLHANTDRMAVVHTDSESDSVGHIEISDDESPWNGIRGSGVMGELGRDPTSGRFTAASFANIPDDLLD